MSAPTVARRLLALCALAGVAACGGGPSPETGMDMAQACRPVDAPLGVGETMAYMAGRYRLSLVRDGGGSPAEVVGTLDLERMPEAYRDRGPVSATLMGSLNIDLSAVGAQELRGLDSMDPEAPGALVVEGRATSGPEIFVRFGSESTRMDRQAFDAAYASLDVRLIEGDAFYGRWQSGVQATRVEGWFCAEQIER